MNDFGEGGGVVGDVLRGRKPTRESITIRLPALVLASVRRAARARGMSVSDAIEACVVGRDPRPTRTAAAVDAAPWASLGYRITRALSSLDLGDAEAAKEELTAARVLVVDTLGKIRVAYDDSLDGVPDREDDWSGTR